jgi:hypothetical protein
LIFLYCLGIIWDDFLAKNMCINGNSGLAKYRSIAVDKTNSIIAKESVSAISTNS